MHGRQQRYTICGADCDGLVINVLSNANLPEPSSLRGSTLGTRAAEHKGCKWVMQVDWWLQPCAVFGHSFSGIIWHMPQK